MGDERDEIVLPTENDRFPSLRYYGLIGFFVTSLFLILAVFAAFIGG
jgi:hypothetical protein